jgi:hypothetical protein
MNPENLVTESLIRFCKNYKTIIICGYTKTGKVKIAKKLAEHLNYPLFISDDYINPKDSTQSLYNLMDAILPLYKSKQPLIVEGVLCFRLLRKGYQLNTFSPDLIIKTVCNNETIKYFYNLDMEAHKINKALSFNKGLNTIWEEYIDLIKNNPIPHFNLPRYIELTTTLPEYSYFP